MGQAPQESPETGSRAVMFVRLLVLGGLFALMYGLNFFTAETAEHTVDPLTLASIGFTALFAYTIGEIVNGFGLPRVTGWILTGVVLGPSVASVYSKDVVGQMEIFNTLALGLIATLAGLELDLKATLKVGKTLAWTVLIKIVFLIVCVGGVFVTIQVIWAPLPEITTVNGAIAFGLIFAVLGIGTSPAIVLAVLNDLNSKGRFSDLLLALAVVKDVVVVVSLAIAIAVAGALLSGGGFDSSALIHVAEEIGKSILAGVIVGGLIIAYIKFIHAEMLLFVVAMILVVAPISKELHLELLLVFIVAGFLVRNYSPFEHELHHPLEVISLPVFVVFFTTAGAALDLEASLTVLPMALALTVARLGAFYAAGRLGAKLGGESAIIQKISWLAYVPQAGVTLGLVLIAVDKLPDYAGMLKPLGMALVALNLLGGPISLGISLKKSGDVPLDTPTEDEEVPVELDPSVDVPAPSEEDDLDEALPEVPYDEIESRLGGDPLTGAVLRMVEVVDTSIREVVENHQAGVRRLFDNSLDLLRAEVPEDARRESVRRFGEQPVDFDLEEETLRMRTAVSDVIIGLTDGPRQVRVPLDKKWLSAKPDDNSLINRVMVVYRRMLRQLHRGISKRGNQRIVPLRTLGRVAFEGEHMQALMDMGDARFRAEAACFAVLRRYLDSELTASAAAREIEHEKRRGLWAIECGGLLHLRGGTLAAIWLVERVDTPVLPLTRVSYAPIEPRIRALHNELMARPQVWSDFFGARRDALLLKAVLEGYRAEIMALIEGRLLSPFEVVDEALVNKSDHINDQLHELLDDLEVIDEINDEQLQAMLERVRQTFSETMRARLKTSTAEFRHHALPHHFTDAITAMTVQAPEALTSIRLSRDETGAMTDVQTASIAFRELASRQLVEEFLPELLHHHSEALDLVSAVPARLSEAVHIAAYAFELHLKGHASSRGPLVDSVQRAIGRVDALEKELKEHQGHMMEALAAEIDVALQRIVEACEPTGEDVLQKRRGTMATVSFWLSRSIKRVGKLLGNLRKRDNIRALRIRTGVEVLAPAQMRTYLAEHLPPPDLLALPPRYGRLYSLGPLDDRRMFVAHKPALSELVHIESAWRRGERAAVLITGPNGCGKTTLLNMFQLEVGVERLIRLYDDFSSRHEGILSALAAELGCDSTVEALQAALSRERTAVFINSLDHWFEPSLEGIERFEAFQNLLVRSSAEALWVVSVQWNALKRFERLFKLRSAFSHHVELKPLDWQETRRVIEVRHQISGLPLSFKHKLGWRERLTFWQAEDDEALYFKRLFEASRGNVRAAIYHHVRAVRWASEAIETADIDAAELPFLGQLPEEALVILTELLRLGPMERSDLQLVLKISPERIDLFVEHLILSGLVSMGYTDEEVLLPVHIQSVLVEELRALQRLPRGSS